MNGLNCFLEALCCKAPSGLPVRLHGSSHLGLGSKTGKEVHFMHEYPARLKAVLIPYVALSSLICFQTRKWLFKSPMSQLTL